MENVAHSGIAPKIPVHYLAPEPPRRPRPWTREELAWSLERRKDGYSSEQIGQMIGRSTASVKVKLKREMKTLDRYNPKHRDMKYQANQQHFDLIQPATVLDLYAGNSWYQGRAATWTNDRDPRFNTDQHEDALVALCQQYAAGKQYDLVDLDPYGSAYDQFDLAIKIAKKGIVITYGELGHKRFRRYDFVRPRYGIAELEDFNVQKMIEETQRIGRTNKKALNVEQVITYGNISRVYFSIHQIKITEQWE